MNRTVIDWGGNIAGLLIVLAVNGLANALPLGGQSTGAISAKYPSLFVPAGYVFSIWGLIYIGLIAFCVWQALPAQRSNQRLASIFPLFFVNCLANAVWLFFWHYDLLLLSFVMMLVILATLVQIYRKLSIVNFASPAADRWFLQLPFGIYTAWITVATIANFSAVQYAYGWIDAGFSDMTWTQIKIAIAASIAILVLFYRRDAAFMLVVVWASAGIAVKQSATPAVAGAATTIAILGFLLAANEMRRRLT